MHKTRLNPNDLPSVEVSTLRRILACVKPHRRRAALVISCMVAAAALNLCLPWFMRRIVDEAIPRGDLKLLWLYCGAMIAGPALAGLLDVVQKYSSELIGQHVMLDLRVALYRQFHAMPFAFFARQQPGEAVSHVLNDVQGVGGAVSGTLADVAQNVIVLVSTTAFVFALDWRLALVALGFLPLFIVPTRRVGQTRKRIKRTVQARVGELTGILTETLSVSGALLIKVFGAEDTELGRFTAKAHEIKQLSLEQSLVGRWFQLLLGLFEAVGPAVVFALGGFLVVKGHIALGTIIAFVTVLKRMYGPARQLAGVHVDLMTSYAYFERIFGVLDRMPSIRDASSAIALPATRGHIALRGVSFSYDGTEDTLSQINLEIPAGATVAIVGPSGAGKSTIGSLVMRLYDVSEGSVAIDGVDVRDVTSRSLHDNLAVVTQETFLFHTTVLDNLRYAKPSASLAEVEDAAKRAQIHDVIASLPDGYQTIVGERGYRFSGGERQRLAIARAILKNPRILILDEATSSLDSESERKVQEALAPLCKGRTTLVIAHRLSTIRDADLIVVLDQGHIVERGTHDELMAHAGLYAWLWRVQAGKRVGNARSMIARIAAAATAAWLLGAAAPASAQVRLAFDKHPSLQVRNLLTVDFRLKSQADLRRFPEEAGTDPKDLFDLHRARVGIEGTFLKRFEYQIELDLQDSAQPWRDVYVDGRMFRALGLRAGQFKIPYGLDQLTGTMDLDFNYRSLAGTYLAPGRDAGVMAHGHLLNDVVRYQAGVFRQGGDNVRSSERTDAQTDRTFAGRVVVKPWNGSKIHRALRSLAVGVAFTDGDLPGGPNSLRGKTVPGDGFFEHLYVKGRRQRIGTELQLRPSSFGVQGEFMRARDQRRGQGVDNENLPDAIAQGWYVSTTWLLTGERKKDSIEPARRGMGAVEIAGRIERLRSSTRGARADAFDSPRSPWIAPRADSVWTAGVNWYVNRYVKLQANVIRERRTVDDAAISWREHLWSRTLRLQFGF